ncbi:MAG: hypothetical protein EOO73_23345 [Myxococcales bacterium]|nr:MAG: hypothetical protein EOO73_23345 [Myxococcales bacterium]
MRVPFLAAVSNHRSSYGAAACLLASLLPLACSAGDESGEAKLSGELAIYESSFKDGASSLHYGLRRPGLPEVTVELAEPVAYAPGASVELAGRFDEKGHFVASSVVRATGEPGLGTSTQALAQPTQTRNVAILLLRPSDQATPAPWVVGKELVANNLFGTASLPDFPAKPQNTDAYYREASYGARALSGNVFDWLTIDPLVDYCDTNALRTAGLAKAAESGIDLSAYQHVGFVVAAGCGNIAGRAELGTPSNPGRYSWYYYEGGSELFIHELGHNFGLQHALVYSCSSGGEAVTIAPVAQCTENPDFPQDVWDPMGIRSFAHFGGYNKMLQGWLAGSNVVTAGPAGGDFTLEPLELASSAPQLLRVPADSSLCPADINPCFYYVEYRQPIGFDGTPQFTNTSMHDGALLRLGGDIDTTGNSLGALTRLPSVHPPIQADTLRVGETFQDPTGLRITTVATPSAGGHQNLVIRVSRASRISATVALSSGQSGATGSYCADVKITNISTTAVNGGWLVRLNLNQSTLSSGWNGTFTSAGGSLYDVTAAAWNATILPGQFTTASFCANKTGASFTPQVAFTTSN